MKQMKFKGLIVPAGLVGVIAAALITGLAWIPAHADPPTAGAAQTNSVVAAVPPAAPVAAPAEHHHLTGAELYSIHCNRCHPERYPTERTAAQWKTIMLHMQVRANIPVQQSRLILKYLQDNSGR
jgi:hypothetical protein